METLLGTLHALGWSIYVGGAVCMELVLRHAQTSMRPSQVAVVCQDAGRRYRWWAAASLMTLLVTGILLAGPLLPDPLLPGPLLAGGTRHLIVWGLFGLWLVQVTTLGLLALVTHPQMHSRADATLSSSEHQVERQRIGAAIRHMDRLLRFELGLALTALLLGSLLHALPLE